MTQNLHPEIIVPDRMHAIFDIHLQGLTTREGMLSVLKWQMAVSESAAIKAFLGEIQGNKNLDIDLVDEVTRTYTEDVQHWVFPEEAGLSKAWPDAIECTFPELVEAANFAAALLHKVQFMLVGVNTRLNLLGSYSAVGQALQLVSKELALLEPACEHVGTGTLLAPGFPGEADEGRPSWSSPGGSPLSPKEIVWLAKLAQSNPELSVKYADGISRHSTPPQLVTERGRASERQLMWAEEYREIEERTRAAMALSCPRCNSAPGKQCRSRAGKETTMHQGRYPAVS